MSLSNNFISVAQSKPLKMPGKSPHYWPKNKVMLHFNVDEKKYYELCTFVRGILDRGGFIGMTFKNRTAKIQLIDRIKACAADFPSFIRGFPEHEQISAVVGTAQVVNHTYCRHNNIFRWKQRRTLDRNSTAPNSSQGESGFVLSDVEDGETVTPFTTPTAPLPTPIASLPTPSFETPAPPKRLFDTAQEVKPETTPTATALTPTVDAGSTATTTPIPQSRPLNSRTILVRNLTDTDCNGLCAISDLQYAAVDPENLLDLSVDDLDFDKWLDFLEQECEYDYVLHVLQHTTPEGDRVRIKSKWSWRAAIHKFLSTDSSTVAFDLMERK